LILLSPFIADLKSRIEYFVDGQLETEIHLHQVRDVSPGKIMVCSSFQISESIAFGKTTSKLKRKLEESQ